MISSAGRDQNIRVRKHVQWSEGHLGTFRKYFRKYKTQILIPCLIKLYRISLYRPLKEEKERLVHHKWVKLIRVIRQSSPSPTV